jgi:hypothetical protein
MFRRPNVSSTKRFVDQMFRQPNVSSTKCFINQTFRRPNVSSTKHFFDQMFRQPNISSTKRFVGQMFFDEKSRNGASYLSIDWALTDEIFKDFFFSLATTASTGANATRRVWPRSTGFLKNANS